LFVSEVFRFQVVGFEQFYFYKVNFRDVEIGEFDAEELRFRAVRPSRTQKSSSEA